MPIRLLRHPRNIATATLIGIGIMAAASELSPVPRIFLCAYIGLLASLIQFIWSTIPLSRFANDLIAFLLGGGLFIGLLVSLLDHGNTFSAAAFFVVYIASIAAVRLAPRLSTD